MLSCVGTCTTLGYALQIIRTLPNHSLDLTSVAQSILVGPDFLLLVPHPTPPPVGSDAKGPLNTFLSRLWRQWPPPHPLAFAGGAVGCPALSGAWMDPEDPRKSDAIVFQPLEFAAQEGNLDALALNDGALQRSLAVLSLTCCDWRHPIPRAAEESNRA